MAGTKAGGQKTREKNLAKNPNYYSDIGKIGGRNGHTGGFAKDDRTFLQKLLRRPKLASIAGKKGGRTSRRKKAGVE